MAHGKLQTLSCLLGLTLAPAVSGQSGHDPIQALQAQRVQGDPQRVRAKQISDQDGELRWDYTVLSQRSAFSRGSPDPTTPGRRKALVNCFQNTLTNGFFVAGSNGSEWLDWASKYAGKTDIVGAFAFRYGTNARGSSEPGGTGASLGVSFYSGTTGFCVRGTRASDLMFFSGLPGATGSQISPFFSVTAILNPGAVFCLPDGKIGWGYYFNEPPRGTYQVGTGPLLAGPVLNGSVSNTCWNDVIDIWSSPDPIASCQGLYFFNCNPPLTFFVPPPCAGFWIQIFEETVNAGSSAIFNNTVGVPNPLRYSETQSANIGEPWITQILTDPLNPAGPEVAGVIRFGVPGTIVPGVPLGFLVNGSRLIVVGTASNILVSNPGVVKVGTLVFPKDLSFLGSTFHTQGFGVILAPIRFQALNGISTTVGAI